MSDFDGLLRCDEHIAALTRRIALLKETPAGGALPASAEFTHLLERTLEGWQEQKRMLLKTSSAQTPSPPLPKRAA